MKSLLSTALFFPDVSTPRGPLPAESKPARSPDMAKHGKAQKYHKNGSLFPVWVITTQWHHIIEPAQKAAANDIWWMPWTQGISNKVLVKHSHYLLSMINIEFFSAFSGLLPRETWK